MLRPPNPKQPPFSALTECALVLSFCAGLSGCLVAGYSTQSGVWVWPGSIVITLVLILIYLLTRHR